VFVNIDTLCSASTMVAVGAIITALEEEMYRMWKLHSQELKIDKLLLKWRLPLLKTNSLHRLLHF
jgi:hypothetical protein